MTVASWACCSTCWWRPRAAKCSAWRLSCRKVVIAICERVGGLATALATTLGSIHTVIA